MAAENRLEQGSVGVKNTDGPHSLGGSNLGRPSGGRVGDIDIVVDVLDAERDERANEWIYKCIRAEIQQSERAVENVDAVLRRVGGEKPGHCGVADGEPRVR